jgi:Mg-chelatase subunit ChlD
MKKGFLIGGKEKLKMRADKSSDGAAQAASGAPRAPAERDRELAEAFKYGRFERANPGPDGSERLKITHKGVVFITDAEGKQEITSWRLDGHDDSLQGPERPRGTHTVIVVDHSGSMRKDDVPGYATRTEAVYDCLARDFLAPQLQVSKDAMAGDAVVSLLEMSDEAVVALERQPITEELQTNIARRAQRRAQSHGNYLPALDAALALLERSIARDERIVLIFLSDGAPSDHCFRECMHGVQVWQHAGVFDSAGRAVLKSCGFEAGRYCRRLIKDQIRSECLGRNSGKSVYSNLTAQMY